MHQTSVIDRPSGSVPARRTPVPPLELWGYIGRYYDPATGQFLTVDPLVDITGEPYAYAAGNPVGEVDVSTGSRPDCAADGNAAQASQDSQQRSLQAVAVSGPQPLGWYVRHNPLYELLSGPVSAAAPYVLPPLAGLAAGALCPECTLPEAIALGGSAAGITGYEVGREEGKSQADAIAQGFMDLGSDGVLHLDIHLAPMAFDALTRAYAEGRVPNLLVAVIQPPLRAAYYDIKITNYIELQKLGAYQP